MNPGSKEAVEAGCLCPPLDNAHGRGSGYTRPDGTPLFWIKEGCPVHADLDKPVDASRDSR